MTIQGSISNVASGVRSLFTSVSSPVRGVQPASQTVYSGWARGVIRAAGAPPNGPRIPNRISLMMAAAQRGAPAAHISELMHDCLMDCALAGESGEDGEFTSPYDLSHEQTSGVDKNLTDLREEKKDEKVILVALTRAAKAELKGGEFEKLTQRLDTLRGKLDALDKVSEKLEKTRQKGGAPLHGSILHRRDGSSNPSMKAYERACREIVKETRALVEVILANRSAPIPAQQSGQTWEQSLFDMVLDHGMAPAISTMKGVNAAAVSAYMDPLLVNQYRESCRSVTENRSNNPLTLLTLFMDQAFRVYKEVPPGDSRDPGYPDSLFGGGPGGADDVDGMSSRGSGHGSARGAGMPELPAPPSTPPGGRSPSLRDTGSGGERQNVGSPGSRQDRGFSEGDVPSSRVSGSHEADRPPVPPRTKARKTHPAPGQPHASPVTPGAGLPAAQGRRSTESVDKATAFPETPPPRTASPGGADEVDGVSQGSGGERQDVGRPGSRRDSGFSEADVPSNRVPGSHEAERPSVPAAPPVASGPKVAGAVLVPPRVIAKPDQTLVNGGPKGVGMPGVETGSAAGKIAGRWPTVAPAATLITSHRGAQWDMKVSHMRPDNAPLTAGGGVSDIGSKSLFSHASRVSDARLTRMSGVRSDVLETPSGADIDSPGKGSVFADTLRQQIVKAARNPSASMGGVTARRDRVLVEGGPEHAGRLATGIRAAAGKAAVRWPTVAPAATLITSHRGAQWDMKSSHMRPANPPGVPGAGKPGGPPVVGKRFSFGETSGVTSGKASGAIFEGISSATSGKASSIGLVRASVTGRDAEELSSVQGATSGAERKAGLTFSADLETSSTVIGTRQEMDSSASDTKPNADRKIADPGQRARPGFVNSPRSHDVPRGTSR